MKQEAEPKRKAKQAELKTKVDHEPFALCPVPYTIYPTACNLYPIPYNLPHETCTRNPEFPTLNPRPRP